MRRLLMVCAVAAMAASVFSVLTVGQQNSVSTAADSVASSSASESNLPVAANGHAPIVLARGAAFRGIALDTHANVYVTNASAPNRIFTLTGITNLSPASVSNRHASANLALFAGNGDAGSLGDGGAAASAQFNLQLNSLLFRSGMAIAPDGTMLIADTLNSTIRRIAGSDSTEPGIVRSVAGRWGPRQEITLSEPLGLALDHAGDLYIADRAADAVDVLPLAADPSANSQLAILAHVSSPTAVALTVDGFKAFVSSAETGAIFEIDTQTHAIRAVPGFTPQANSSQQASGCAQQSATPGPISAPCPAGLAVDGSGNLFVADSNFGRILRIDAKSRSLATAASDLEVPGDMSFDSAGNLYVAEQGANRLLKFAALGDPASNLTIAAPAALPPPPAPRVCPQTAPYNFCDEPTGGSTPTQAFTLTNNSSAAVSNLALSFTGANPGDFQAASNNCGTSLASGASCSINVDFAPTTSGARAASLSVTDSAGDSATANLSGTGDDYQITLNGTNQEQSIFQGGAITYKFNVTPDAVFGGVVTIVCPVTTQLPTLTTCTANPATVTVTPGTPAPFSITFATTYNGVTASTTTSGSATLVIPFGPNNPSGPASPIWILAFALLASLVVLGFLLALPPTKPRWSLSAASASLVLLILSAVLFLSACKKSPIQPGLNTPVGISNLTIQGSAQNAARGNSIILDVIAH